MRSIAELLRMDGRVALVTGASGNIGRAIAETLAELGASVLIVDRRADALEAVARRLRDEWGGRVELLEADLEDPEASRTSIPQFVASGGRLDVLVNNAAFVGTSDVPGWAVRFEDQSSSTWRRAIEVNLTAPFVLSQRLAPLLAEHGTGSIINIGSVYGTLGPDLRLYAGTGMGNPAAYAASKGGLLQLTRYLATILAPTVRVNAISPGGVERGQPPSFRERYTARTPLGRMAVEEDLKGAAAYLASDLSRYVTGHELMVDGGWSAW